MSRLYTRALAALKGLHAGEGEPPAGGMLDWSLKLGGWLVDRRPGPHAAHRIAAPDDRTALPSPPAGLPRAHWAAGAGVVVGLLRRPQDQNGIVDDAVTLVSPLWDSSTEIAGACALAAFLAAVVDGWDMEGALSQSLFVAKRGETFGRERGPSVARAMDELLEHVYAAPDRDQAARTALTARTSIGEGGGIVRAIALAYVAQEPDELFRLASRWTTADLRCVTAIAAMLTAAHEPEGLPAGVGRYVEERTDVAELLDELLELRAARYRRAPQPQYAARFRRKKC